MFPCFDLVVQRQWATNAKNMVLVVQYFLTRLLLFHHMGNVSCISKGMTEKSKIENTRVVHWATIYAKPTLDHWVLSSLSFCLFSKLIITNHKWRIYVNVYAFQSSYSSTFFLSFRIQNWNAIFKILHDILRNFERNIYILWNH